MVQFKKRSIPKIIFPEANMKKTLEFLKNLEANNGRDWFHQHKTERLEAAAEFELLIQSLITEIGKFDETITHLHDDPKSLTFKLNRDTRFSHDKSPYNPTFRAHIGPQGKLPIPAGYFIAIRPGDQSFIGGGLFADMFSDATAMIREHLSASGKEIMNILEAPEFISYFEVKGTKLKNVPKGYDKESPIAELLKHKSWYLEHPVSDSQLLDSEAFIKSAAEMFERMMPFNHFLNQALDGFEMPRR